MNSYSALKFLYQKLLLVSGIFSESTANGLDFYSSDYAAFAETACYVKFIGNIWKIVSLKTEVYLGVSGLLKIRSEIFRCKSLK